MTHAIDLTSFRTRLDAIANGDAARRYHRAIADAAILRSTIDAARADLADAAETTDAPALADQLLRGGLAAIEAPPRPGIDERARLAIAELARRLVDAELDASAAQDELRRAAGPLFNDVLSAMLDAAKVHAQALAAIYAGACAIRDAVPTASPAMLGRPLVRGVGGLALEGALLEANGRVAVDPALVGLIIDAVALHGGQAAPSPTYRLPNPSDRFSHSF